MFYTNSAMRTAIEELVHVQRHRTVLVLRYCDGLTYDEISNETSFSPQHVKYICKNYKNLLMNHI